MVSLLSSNYLTRRPIELAVEEFGQRFNKRQTVIDIGCGDKPYAKFFQAKYLGVDPFADTKSDIKAPAWDIPLPDQSADGIILTQSLEHIQKTERTISEIYRLLKPGGLVFISAPQTMRNHSLPMSLKEAPVKNIPPEIASVWKEDYYRFNKYGLLYLFRNFKPLKLRETRTTFTTIIQQFNYFLSSLGIGWLAIPLFLINNLLGVLVEGLFDLVRLLPIGAVKRFDELIIRGMTTDYVYIGQKPKP